MRRTRKIAIIVFAVFVVCALVLLLHSVGSKSELVRYKAELRAKGDKLTYSEFAVPPSTNPAQVASRNIFATNKFNYGGPDIELMEYVAPGKVKVAWRGNMHVFPASSGPAPTNEFIVGDWSELDNRIKGYIPKLEVFRAALANPAVDSGWYYRDSVQNMTNAWVNHRPPLVSVRMVFLALTDCCVGRLHRGDREAAFEDLKAIAALSQIFKNDPTLVMAFIRGGVVNGGVDLIWQALQMPGWNEGELKSLQEAWEAVDILEPLGTALMADRAKEPLIAELIRRTSSGKMDNVLNVVLAITPASPSPKANLRDYWNEHIVPTFYKMTTINRDELLATKQLTAQVESIRMLKANRPWPEVSLILSNQTKDFDNSLGGKWRICPYYLSSMTVPLLDRGLRMIGEAETDRRLTIAAIAIKRFELKYEKAPPSLQALVPEFLTAVPIDMMNGRLLGYRLKNDGTYVLYSAGLDGKDDGGDPTPVATGGKAGLWEGRDAVWPTAALDDEVAKYEAAALQNTNKSK